MEGSKKMRRDPHWTICGKYLCFLDLFEDKIRILKLDDLYDELLEKGKPEFFEVSCKIIDFSMIRTLD